MLTHTAGQDTVQYNFIAKCQYNCMRNVLWCQVHSSHIHSNRKTSLNYNSKQTSRSWCNKSHHRMLTHTSGRDVIKSQNVNTQRDRMGTKPTVWQKTNPLTWVWGQEHTGVESDDLFLLHRWAHWAHGAHAHTHPIRPHHPHRAHRTHHPTKLKHKTLMCTVDSSSVG